MPLLLQAIEDEIVVREAEDVGRKAVQATPPVRATEPL